MSDAEENEGVKTTMPLARVRRIMKLDSDVRHIGGEAVVLIAKATVCYS